MDITIGPAIYQLVNLLIFVLIIAAIISFFGNRKRQVEQLVEINKKLDRLLAEKETDQR
ncbi:hypothetical protein [Halalkalibacter oceani]|uniref:DUF4083 domain-containing protein n=1 Tax=Halalkalibacter oceani TaxID=1653776 RepID=A0A9X2DMT6_9BACI|nr:hypothetical protein [Halalkalibacter oceani]MCM3712945.1 hypothetical protein [Halalkalibacter oceani]